MKRIFAALLVISLAVCNSMAQSGLISAKKIYTKKNDVSEYAVKGIVPMENGKVVYAHDIKAEGKSKAELYNILASFASLRFEPNSGRGDWREANFFKNTEYARVINADKATGTVEAQGAEEMIFSNKTLQKDYTHAYYKFTAKAEDGKISIRIDNIAYIYVGSQQTERIPAEDWITDEEALNKKGGLRRISGKFRIKTIDLFNEITDEIASMVK